MNSKTKKILNIFEEICKIPRCSNNEQQIINWLCSWAKEMNYSWKNDKEGNLVVNIPATKGYENKPIIIMQAHVDMVCEKVKDYPHDFSKDPIKLIYEDDWLKADKTSLGADNGIAIAIMLELAQDNSISHPELELLFTVDEETGLNGANNLGNIINGKILINLDSETEGQFIIGCAGGNETHISLPVSYISASNDKLYCCLKVRGLKGGHSGIDINSNRANANSLLARILYKLYKSFSFDLISIKGGSAHNAIPRDAEAVIAIDSSQYNEINSKIIDFEKIIQYEFEGYENSILINLKKISDYKADKKLEENSKVQLINIIMAFPTGVFDMSSKLKGLVETSNNFAEMSLNDQYFKIISSQRSSEPSKLDYLTNKIESIAKAGNLIVTHTNDYPPWKPDYDSQLLKQSKDIYQKVFNKNPVIESIHAGLECCIIGSKFSIQDMISFGPTIVNPHSPEERVQISSIDKIWLFITELLKSF